MGKADVEGRVQANSFRRSCRGNDDGMHAQENRRNTGSPNGDRSMGQLAPRERQAGLFGVAERFAVPMKPGNSGGGKGPQLEANATSNAGKRDWR